MRIPKSLRVLAGVLVGATVLTAVVSVSPAVAGTTIKAPGAPTDVKVIGGTGLLDVSWTAPASDGGSPITAYTVTATPGPLTCSTNVGLTCTFTIPTGVKTLTISVRAFNAVGLGRPSKKVKVTVPGAPTGVKAVGVDDAIGVSWTAPASDGGIAVTGYTVTATPGTATCATTGATTCSVLGLANGTAYSITVQATNSMGAGKSSRRTRATPSTTQNCSYFGPGANLQGCNLANANLANADLFDANLTSATLTDANLAYADLSGADLTSTELTGADLYGANLTNSNLSGADLSGTTLAGLFSGGIIGTPSALPSGWILMGGYLIGPGAYLSYANLSGLDLANIDLANANLISSNLTSTNLAGATLTGVEYGGIIGTPAALPSGWSLMGGYLIGPGAYLSYANLSGFNLSGLNLSSAVLYGANLSGANLTDANLTDANLTEANLDAAILTGANLTGVTWSNDTCPDGTNSNNDGGTCLNNLTPD
jgi:uncharacterized protein YjbI with pentapeptide repeats